jgi:MSHA biogenesis protein MshI
MRWSFNKGKQQGWMSVALGEGLARFAQVTPARRPKVNMLEERKWNTAEPKELERIAKEMGSREYQCTTLLGQPDYQIVLVEAPNVKRDELKAAVRWRIKDMIDFHVDDATIDVLDIPAGGGVSTRPPSMYVVVTRNDTVQRVVDRFEQARIPLQVIDIPDAAQRNIAALYEEKDRGLLMLSFDADGGLITVTAGGELYLSRRLDIGYAQVSSSEAERSHALDRVLVEVQRSLDHFERNFTQVSIAKVLVAPVGQSAALIAHLTANLYLPIASMELGEVMDLPQSYLSASADVRAGWFRLIGAGLRVEPTTL